MGRTARRILGWTQRFLLLAWALVLAEPAAAGDPGQPEQDVLVPVLPDIEWRVGGLLAVDVLGRSTFTGTERHVDLRKARMGAAVLWRNTLAASISADLAYSGRLGQASLAYFGLPVYFEVGRFPEPFGLIQQEGSSAQRFMELPAGTALAPGYGLGLAATVHDRRHAATLAAFAPTSSADRINRVRRRESAVTARFTGAPLMDHRGLLHLGGSFSLRRPHEEAIRFSTIPETVLVPELDLESAPLAVDHYSLWAAEFAALAGPFLLQAEHVVTRLPAIEGVTPSFKALYVEAGLALGAEPRGYSTTRGVFGPLYPSSPVGDGGFGAVELAIRYSTLDMTSDLLGDLVAQQGSPELRDPYSGERGIVRAVGINWYATDDVKLSLDALAIENESRSTDQDAHVVQGRVQIQFARP